MFELAVEPQIITLCRASHHRRTKVINLDPSKTPPNPGSDVLSLHALEGKHLQRRPTGAGFQLQII